MNLPATVMTPDEITAVLQGAGAIDEQAVSAIRMKVDGTNFVTENDLWISNPKTGEPAFTARLIDVPVQYQGFWFTEAFAMEAGRPEMANRFCKSHYDVPSERREYGTNGASCRACPFNPFQDRKEKCGWKGDLMFQIMRPDGSVGEEDPIYSLTLTVTGMIEWKGTRRAPSEGSATDKNFMYKLAEFAMNHAAEWGVEPDKAILLALSALGQGMVAAEFRIARQTNDTGSFTWSVPVLTPVHVEIVDDNPQLEAGEDPLPEPSEEGV